MTDQWQRLRGDGYRVVTDPLADHERRLKALEGLSPDQVGGTRQQIVVVDQKADSAQAEALTAREESLQAQADALEAAANALQAAADATAAQQQTSQLEQSIAQPGVNKFDTAPIAAQNIAGYYTENLTGYSWLTGGIRLQTPADVAVGVRVYTMGTFAVRPGDVLSASVNLVFDNPAVAGFGWSFFDADGAPIASSASSIATENGLLQSEYQVPSAAASLRMNLFAYVPAGYAVTRTWVNFTRPYVGILVGSDGLAKAAVQRVNIAPGAVGTAELDPSISFTPADGSITTEKLADGAATDSKIAGMNASKLTGTVALARLPASITGRTSVGGTTGQFTNLLRADGTAWVKDAPKFTKVGRSANLALTANAWTPVPWQFATLNESLTWTSGNPTALTCTATGVFDADVFVKAQINSGAFNVRLTINGTVLNESLRGLPGTAVEFPAPSLRLPTLSLTAGDVVVVTVQSSVNGNLDGATAVANFTLLRPA